MEAVRTNVMGTEHVLTAAIEAEVACVVCLSTDKAAYPVNVMGLTKALEERVAVAKSRHARRTKICCTRYGNVMFSRGSVLPLWMDQLRRGQSLTVTEPGMTRFLMSLEEAVDLILFAINTRSSVATSWCRRRRPAPLKRCRGRSGRCWRRRRRCRSSECATARSAMRRC